MGKEKPTRNIAQNFYDLHVMNSAGLLADFDELPRAEQTLTAAQLTLLTAKFQNKSSLDKMTKQIGFDNAYAFESGNIEGLVLVEDGKAFVAICGTNELADLGRHARGLEKVSGFQAEAIYADKIKVQPAYYDASLGDRTGRDGSVHGILSRELKKLHEKGEIDSIHFMGFSDGGNVATLVATQMQIDANRGSFPMEVGSLHVFDAPPSGNKYFAQLVEDTLGAEKYNRVDADKNMVNALWRGQQFALGFRQPSVGEISVAEGVKKHSLTQIAQSLYEDVGAERHFRAADRVEAAEKAEQAEAEKLEHCKGLAQEAVAQLEGLKLVVNAQYEESHIDGCMGLTPNAPAHHAGEQQVGASV